MDPFYAIVRVIARFWIWFFFERVEVRPPERVPPRKVHYLATAALFYNRRLRHQLRFGALLLTRAQEGRRLLAERHEIVEELERVKRDYLEGRGLSSRSPRRRRAG